MQVQDVSEEYADLEIRLKSLKATRDRLEQFLARAKDVAEWLEKERLITTVQRKLLDLPGVAEANVEVVFDPPWSLARVSPDGKKTLGLP